MVMFEKFPSIFKGKSATKVGKNPDHHSESVFYKCISILLVIFTGK